MSGPTFIQPPAKRPKPLSRPKAGEALPCYGVTPGSNSLRIGLRARELAVVNRALSILGATCAPRATCLIRLTR